MYGERIKYDYKLMLNNDNDDNNVNNNKIDTLMKYVTVLWILFSFLIVYALNILHFTFYYFLLNDYITNTMYEESI